MRYKVRYEDKGMTGLESAMLDRPTLTYIEFLELLQTNIFKKSVEVIADINKDLEIYQICDEDNPDASGIRVKDLRTGSTAVKDNGYFKIMHLVKPLALGINDAEISGSVYVVCPYCGMIHSYKGDMDIDINFKGIKNARCKTWLDDFKEFYIGGIEFKKGDLKLFDDGSEDE